MKDILHPDSNLNANHIIKVANEYKTPAYIYDEQMIINKCKEIIQMPNAYGLKPRFAMKALSSKRILKIIYEQGFGIDASSLNEAKRAINAGIKHQDIMLTTQEVPEDKERTELEQMMLKGLKYNVCSIRQYEKIEEFAAKNKINLSIRIHPGLGSGESSTRNTGDKYSCFGVHLDDIENIIKRANNKGIIFDSVHEHIGSGGSPTKWRENVDLELKFIEEYFPNAKNVSFGGGLKVARMDNDTSASPKELGEYAKTRIEEFYKKTGRKLTMEVEPGTYIVANCGFIITKVVDKKQTGKDGFKFLILDGGMEVNTRPLLYGSKHPFYMVSNNGQLIFNEFHKSDYTDLEMIVPVGICCESGDSQSLDEEGHIVPRLMKDPKIEDYFIIGGAGAYCSSMSPFNYNSHLQVPEVLLTKEGKIELIRKRQTFDQIIQNEL